MPDDLATRADRLRHVRLDLPTAQTLADMRAVVEDWFRLRAGGDAVLSHLLRRCGDYEFLAGQMVKAGFAPKTPFPAENPTN